MGFTHYFTRARTLPLKVWCRAVKDCQTVCQASGVPISFDYDFDEVPPAFTEGQIRFNGRGQDGHETFLVPRIARVVGGSGRPSDFCKTARCPYDLPVTACLLVLKHYFPGQFEVGSDGQEGAFAAAKALCQKVLGYGEGMTVTS